MHSLETNQAEFFFDEEQIACSHRLERRIHSPAMVFEPVLKPDKPWEANMTTLFGTILYEPEIKRYRMWYQSVGRDPSSRFKDMFICLAESEDLLHWEKPLVGIHQYKGEETNILIAPRPGACFAESATIIRELDTPNEQRRYQSLYYIHYKDDPDKLTKSGLYRAFSPDGVHWDCEAERFSDMGDRGNLCPVKIDGQYMYYGRVNFMLKKTLRRTCWVTMSPDFDQWSEPELVMEPSLEDPIEREFYSMSAFPVGSQYLGVMQRINVMSDTLDLELISSRDGISWTRLTPNEPFMTHGEFPWCSTWLDAPSNGPIAVANQWFWFIAGRSYGHAGSGPHPHGAIGVATQKKEQVVSITADRWPGELLTNSLRGSGKYLRVLWDPQLQKFFDPGKLRVSIVGPDGAALDGYEDGHPSEPDNDGWWIITWDDSDADIRLLLSKPFQIKFEIENSHLFAYKISAE